jgi:tyrosyl-tRNA synthetase
MSKSLGNAIGIHEPPQGMFGKIMSISDDLMWRFYELLTDVKSAEIESLKQKCTRGEAHPMQMKKDLARMIVTDFHSAAAAQQAQADWEAMFQKGKAAENIEEVAVPFTSIADGDQQTIRVDKLLVAAGLSASRSEAQRKIKENAVSIDGNTITDFSLRLDLPANPVVRLGKKMKRAVISS